MDPIIGGALIGAGATAVSGLVGAGMNKRAVREANKGNMELAQFNNQWNANEAAKAREWQERMMREQNLYNSPANQRRLKEQAGYNPYMDLSQTSSVSAGSSPVPSAQSVQLSPEMFDMSSIPAAINSFYANRKFAEEATGRSITNALDLSYGADFRKSQIASLIDGRFEFLSPDYKKLRMGAALDIGNMSLTQMRQEIAASKAYTELNLAQGIYTNLQAEGQRILNRFADKQQVADLFVKSASAFNQYKSGVLSEQKFKESVQDTAKLAAETQGIYLNNRQVSRLSDSLIESLNQQYNYDAEYYKALRAYAQKLGSAEGSAKVEEAALRALEKRMDRQSLGDVYGGHLGRFNRSLKRTLDDFNPIKGLFK